MSGTATLAYLDAGTGAALAAVVASGAVGARALFSTTKSKVRRKLGGARDAGAPATDTDPEAPPAPGRAR